jgi:hypothetical protein
MKPRSDRRTRLGGDGMPAMKRALENAGIVFLASKGDDGPGVRLPGNRPNIVRKPTKMNPYYQLPFAVEWRGKEFIVFLGRDAMDDLDRAREHRRDAEYVACFENNRAEILALVAAKIDAGKVEPGDRVLLTSRDFPSLQ